MNFYLQSSLYLNGTKVGLVKMDFCDKRITGIISVLHVLVLGFLCAQGSVHVARVHGKPCLQHLQDSYHPNPAFLSVIFSPTRRSNYRFYSPQPKFIWFCANANEGKKTSNVKNWFKTLIRRRSKNAVQEFPSWNREALEMQIQAEEGKMQEIFTAQEAETVQRPIAGWGLFSIRVFRNQRDIIRAAWNKAVQGSPNQLKAIKNPSNKFPAVQRLDPSRLEVAKPRTVSLDSARSLSLDSDRGTSTSAPEKRGLQITSQTDADKGWQSPALHNVDVTAGPTASQGAVGDSLRQMHHFQNLRTSLIASTTGTAADTNVASNLSAHDKPQSSVAGKRKEDVWRNATGQRWSSGVGGTGADRSGVTGGDWCGFWRVVGRQGVAVRGGAERAAEAVGTQQQGDVLDVVEQRDGADGWAWLRLREVWEWRVGPQTWARAAEAWVPLPPPPPPGQSAGAEQLALRGEGGAAPESSEAERLRIGAGEESRRGGQAAEAEQLVRGGASGAAEAEQLPAREVVRVAHWEPALVGVRGRGLWKVAAGGVRLADRPDASAKEVRSE